MYSLSFPDQGDAEFAAAPDALLGSTIFAPDANGAGRYMW
jgi:hypothetical protein